ncbi:MAG: hypothetical protein B5766_08260 [Candidatus Lumbricidophila eiseniae]|uniref:Uncharacterized protein n=1 Tax=Candidatus Lumbricidiphila eiseniae TaxID=1969409 RepID=A0A2A6FRD5_9MICO|nr:MAG: hypothetical protein B5766_08260 [Candidatus Lumbricidophila eiseniae]
MAAIDNREVTPLTVGAWHEAIGHLDYGIARRALAAVRRDPNIAYVEPRHILVQARVVIREDKRAEEKLAASKLPDHKPAPLPVNYAAMVAAGTDPVAFALEVAVYHRQLVAAGYSPEAVE